MIYLIEDGTFETQKKIIRGSSFNNLRLNQISNGYVGLEEFILEKRRRIFSVNCI